MLAFIEGSMERQFVNSNFKYVRVIPVQNGISWTPERLCERIVTLFLAINYHGRVFVWIDREGRTISAEDLGQMISVALTNAGAAPDNLHILINDRMSENVILADECVIQNEFSDPTFQYNHEGQNGKHLIKSLFSAVSINYKETVHGVRLLNKIRLANAAKTSPTVANFLNGFNEECWWVDSP